MKQSKIDLPKYPDEQLMKLALSGNTNKLQEKILNPNSSEQNNLIWLLDIIKRDSDEVLNFLDNPKIPNMTNKVYIDIADVLIGRLLFTSTHLFDDHEETTKEERIQKYQTILYCFRNHLDSKDLQIIIQYAVDCITQNGRIPTENSIQGAPLLITQKELISLAKQAIKNLQKDIPTKEEMKDLHYLERYSKNLTELKHYLLGSPAFIKEMKKQYPTSQEFCVFEELVGADLKSNSNLTAKIAVKDDYSLSRQSMFKSEKNSEIPWYLADKNPKPG